jgi:hypothetical protein
VGARRRRNAKAFCNLGRISLGVERRARPRWRRSSKAGGGSKVQFKNCDRTLTKQSTHTAMDFACFEWRSRGVLFSIGVEVWQAWERGWYFGHKTQGRQQPTAPPKRMTAAYPG